MMRAQNKGGAPDNTKRNTKVVFVSEHGAALSVVSAAYFNKIAREHHLNLYAIARGTTPQKELAVSASEGLKADGVPFETQRPTAFIQQRCCARAADRHLCSDSYEVLKNSSCGNVE